MSKGEFDSKVWFDKLHGGFWFEYRDIDGEMTEDGPFNTIEEAHDRLQVELSDLLLEKEYDV
jgi:hypothetical protein